MKTVRYHIDKNDYRKYRRRNVMKMKKIAVLGAGAVGSYVIWGLSKRDDISLGVVAEGERANRLKNGCIINGVTYHPEVWTPQEAQGADLLIIALKYGALYCEKAAFICSPICPNCFTNFGLKSPNIANIS